MNPHALRLVPPPPPPTEHALWTLTKAAHQAEARVRATPGGPELRILIDGELWWSQVVRPATDDAMTSVAELKRMEFEAKGWALSRSKEYFVANGDHAKKESEIRILNTPPPKPPPPPPSPPPPPPKK